MDHTLPKTRNTQATSTGPVYCMGYWSLPANKKNNIDHYQRYLERSLAMLAGERLVFFHDDAEISDQVRVICAKHKIVLDARKIPLIDLPASAMASKMTAILAKRAKGSKPAHFETSAEKDVVHYWRDFLGSGAQTYQAMLSIWLSKVALVNLVCSDPCYRDALVFCWVDATIARMNYVRPSWNFTKISSPRGKISAYPNRMQVNQKRIPLSAGVLLGDREAWRELHDLFDPVLAHISTQDYAHDEETILSRIHKTHPDLFSEIGFFPPKWMRAFYKLNGLLRASK